MLEARTRWRHLSEGRLKLLHSHNVIPHKFKLHTNGQRQEKNKMTMVIHIKKMKESKCDHVSGDQPYPEDTASISLASDSEETNSNHLRISTDRGHMEISQDYPLKICWGQGKAVEGIARLSMALWECWKARRRGTGQPYPREDKANIYWLNTKYMKKMKSI